MGERKQGEKGSPQRISYCKATSGDNPASIPASVALSSVAPPTQWLHDKHCTRFGRSGDNGAQAAAGDEAGAGSRGEDLVQWCHW